jgi:hypothetical protein
MTTIAEASAQPETATPSEDQVGAGHDRRRSGRRARTRDRLMDRAVQDYAPPDALRGTNDLANLLLFLDDDMRETAIAMTRIEEYLGRTLQTLESPELRREHIHALAADARVLDHLDLLTEALESLRRRLAKLSANMK